TRIPQRPRSKQRRAEFAYRNKHIPRRKRTVVTVRLGQGWDVAPDLVTPQFSPCEGGGSADRSGLIVSPGRVVVEPNKEQGGDVVHVGRHILTRSPADHSFCQIAAHE